MSYAYWAFGQYLGCGMDIPGSFPPFSIPFQSGVGEGAAWEIAWPLQFAYALSPGAKDNSALWSAQHHQAMLAQGPGWSMGRVGVCRPSPGNPGGNAQEEKQAQWSFLPWAFIPFSQGTCLAY